MSGPFRSVEEAYAFIKSHEIATNNKYVVAKSKGITTQDLTSLDSYNIQWEYTSGVRPCSQKVNDGIPFIYFGVELRDCQYGPPRKRPKSSPTQDSKDTDKQEAVTIATESPQSSGNCSVKRRRAQPSKKLNCQSKLKIKKIMKFPEYAIEVGKEYPGNFKSELGKQLKANFTKDTKRYIQVYVHIDNNHNHGNTPIEVQPKYKKIVHAVDKGCTRISVDSAQRRTSTKVPVLKKWASLKGKNLMDLAMQFKTTAELPGFLAQPKPDQKLEDLQDEELLSLYHDITGEMPNTMFSVANKEFTSSNLRLLLHLCIVFANAACEDCRHLQAHHSVRIKGTENNFTPAQCLELDCAIIEAHMHCPLCCKTDCYTDPGLLKSHFKIRHVDKAIEFAGLRILRCYDNCEVTGKNKECKTFKGGHWHCYNCRNGLDKRNSALAHYQSHLRNYESNFQIQVSQDVNAVLYGYTVPHEIDVTQVPIESYQSTVSLNSVSSTAKSSCSSSPLKRSYADTGLETIDDTAMYVQDDGIGNVTSTYTAQEIPTAGNETYVITMPDSGEVTELRNKVRELEMNCRELEKKNTIQKSLIEFLQTKDANQTKLLEQYKIEKQELLSQLDTYKSEITELKSTARIPSIAVDRDIPSTFKHHKSVSQTTGISNNAPSDVDVSLNKAKELEKRLKNDGKESLVPGHRYGTRRATRKRSMKKSSDDLSGDTKVSKQNVEKVTGSQNETVADSVEKVTGSQNETLTVSQSEKEPSECGGTSHKGTMEEMFNQLSSMRREIDLLKQTTLISTSVQRVYPQQPGENTSDINNSTLIGTTIANTSASEPNCFISEHNAVVNSNVSYTHIVPMLHNHDNNFSETPNAPTYYETNVHFPDKRNLSSHKIINTNVVQISKETDPEIHSTNCSSTRFKEPITLSEIRANTSSVSSGETSEILNINQQEYARTGNSRTGTLLPTGLSTSSNAGCLATTEINTLSTSINTPNTGSSVHNKAVGSMDNLYAAARMVDHT